LSAQIEERLGNAVFSFGGETMELVVGLKLTLGGYTLSVAESCTGGLLAQRLTSVPGSSKYFIEGVVTYANDAKTRALGVEPMLLMEYGAVSAPVAEAMAEGMRKRAGTDFALSITGVAGPDGGTDEKPVGTVFIALANEFQTEHRKLNLPGDRNLVRWRASQAALDLLRRRLL
jgi:nicotinamide-nucleotide amidase